MRTINEGKTTLVNGVYSRVPEAIDPKHVIIMTLSGGGARRADKILILIKTHVDFMARR